MYNDYSNTALPTYNDDACCKTPEPTMRDLMEMTDKVTTELRDLSFYIRGVLFGDICNSNEKCCEVRCAQDQLHDIYDKLNQARGALCDIRERL